MTPDTSALVTARRSARRDGESTPTTVRSFPLDPRRLRPDAEGLADFFWPVGRSEMEAVRETLRSEVLRRIRSARNPTEADVLSALGPWFMNEALRLYQAQALARRFREAGFRLDPGPGGSGMLAALLERRGIPPGPLGHALEAGPAAGAGRLPVPLRRVARSIGWNAPAPQALRRRDLRQDVSCVDAGDLVHRHARSESRIVRYALVRDFLPGTAATPVPCPRASDAFVDAAFQAFDAGGEKPGDTASSHLDGWAARNTGAAAASLRALLARPETLPANLWSGSGADVWKRLLRHAVHRAGGETVVHDHGTGKGHVANPQAAITELAACTTFVTFTEARAQALRREMETMPLAGPPPRAILGMPGRRWRPRRRGSRGPVRRLMYASSFYNGDRVHLAIQLPDVVAVDWEARLFGRLLRWGYAVLDKPHPWSVSPPPAAFQEMGVNVLDRPFERVMGLADAFLFVNPNSTAYVSAVASGKPIIYIDFGQYRWHPEARDLLARRCRIVEGWFDEANRAQVDWDELRSAVPEAVHLLDRGFEEAYFG